MTSAELPRNLTRPVSVGGVSVGGGAPVAVQSMTNTDTGDADATLAQIGRLAKAGCEIIRCAVPNEGVLESFSRICEESPPTFTLTTGWQSSLRVVAPRGFESIPETSALSIVLTRLSMSLGSLASPSGSA